MATLATTNSKSSTDLIGGGHSPKLNSTGLHFQAVPRLPECCRQAEAEVICNSRNKIHQTWEQPYSEALYYLYAKIRQRRIMFSPCAPAGDGDGDRDGGDLWPSLDGGALGGVQRVGPLIRRVSLLHAVNLLQQVVDDQPPSSSQQHDPSVITNTGLVDHSDTAYSDNRL